MTTKRKRRCYLVLGMHRSGTSSVAGAFAHLKIRPPKSLFRGPDNIKGHWEALTIADFNDKLLLGAKTNWSDWRSVDFSHYDPESLKLLREEAREIIRHEFDDEDDFVLKDPRICRILPFWLEVLDAGSAIPVIVMPIRSHVEVARSLKARNDIGEFQGTLLWLRHLLDSEYQSRELPRAIFRWQEFIENWEVLISRVELVHGVKISDYANSVELNEFVDSSLNHHFNLTGDIYKRSQVDDWAERVFELLTAISLEAHRDEKDQPTVYAELDKIRVDFNNFCDLNYEINEELVKRTTSLSIEIQKSERERHNATIALDAASQAMISLEHSLISSEASKDSVVTELSIERELNLAISHEISDLKLNLCEFESICKDLRETLSAEKKITEEQCKASLKMAVELDSANQEISDYHSKLIAVVDDISHLTQNNSLLKDELVAAIGMTASVEQTAKNYLLEINSLEEKLREAESERENAHEDQNRLRVDLMSITDEIYDLRRRLDGAQAELSMLKASKSWRMTASARLFVRILAMLRKSPSEFLRGSVKKAFASMPRVNARLSPHIGSFLRHYNRRKILHSGFYNDNYYLGQNLDVKAAGVDPLDHYIFTGAFEGRNPNSNFDSLAYLEANPDVRKSGQNPLLHFLRAGKAENRQAFAVGASALASTRNSFSIDKYLELVESNKGNLHATISSAVTIVIPVFNGARHLKRLLPSLAQNTALHHTFVFIDDASTDPEISVLLTAFSTQRPNTKHIVHKVNKGFVASVNEGAEFALGNFIILNTDTEVPPGWVDRLVSPLTEGEKVASVTPFTNSGTIFSFPVQMEDNSILPGLSISEINNAFKATNSGHDPLNAPTGVGFCMAISKVVWNEIGNFDQDTFKTGFGEETDWCRRAIAAGFKHVLAADLFVYHEHGGSFSSSEKSARMQDSALKLIERWPDYSSSAGSHIINDPWRDRRAYAFLNICLAKSPEIFLDHDLGGGANEYRRGSISEVLANGGAAILITFDIKTRIYSVVAYLNEYSFSFFSMEFQCIRSLLLQIESGRLTFNNIVGWEHPAGVVEMLTAWGASPGRDLKLLLHDYFPICPSYTLLNSSGVYCGIPRDLSICDSCLVDNPYAPFAVKMVQWRNAWQEAIDIADDIVVFSASSAQLLGRAYKISGDKLKVLPHSALIDWTDTYKIPVHEKELIIGIVGGIGYQKGARIVAELARYFDVHKIPARIVIIGELDSRFLDNWDRVTVHGKYDRSELPQLLLRYKVRICVFPSIWPETFSYVTQELMSLGVPLIAFDIGAPAERLRNYNRGAVVSSFTSEALWSAIDKLNRSL